MEVIAETFGVFVRYFLTITPPLPQSEQHDAQIRGAERYEVFVAQIAKRIASDSHVVPEIMQTIAETHPGMANGVKPQRASEPLEGASHG